MRPKLAYDLFERISLVDLSLFYPFEPKADLGNGLMNSDIIKLGSLIGTKR